jgi:hypothetical protein
MQELINEMMKALEPVINDVLAPLLVALLGTLGAMLLTSVRRYFGLKAEQLMREALNRALETGVKQSTTSIEAKIQEQAVAYAKRSVPDAIKGLQARDSVMMDKAKAIIKGQGR